MKVKINTPGHWFHGKKGTVVHTWTERGIFKNRVYFIVNLDNSVCDIQVRSDEIEVINESENS